MRPAARMADWSVYRSIVEIWSAYRRACLIGLGCFCVLLGAIGAVLPVMPTTIFLLIALWAFADSSPRLHRWLLTNPYYGPYIREWHEHRVIPVRAKCLAVAMIGASFGWLALGTQAPVSVVAGVAVVLIAVVAFIVTRKSRPTASV